MDTASTPGRLRVLISSHEFSPERGSECAVGWNIVTRLAQYHEVTVLCADGPALQAGSYRDEVARHFSRCGECAGLTVVFVEQPPATLRYARINRLLMKLTRGIGWQPLYYQGLDHWHKAALQRGRELGLENFDLVHQLTPISFRRPGYLWSAGLPFFWGPVGGMYQVPWAFARSGGVGSLLFEALRSLAIAWQTRWSRQVAGAAGQALRVWTVTRDEARVIDALAKGRATPMIDTSPAPEIRGFLRRYHGGRPLKICWSGRHVAIKALPLLLRAVALLPAGAGVELHILGEGPETRRWQGLARKLSLSNITWHGQLPYQEALRTMAGADILVHTSFREAASMVVLEALGWGMPVLCHDACGMALAVDDSCGIKVPLVNPEKSVQGFRDALCLLLGNPQLVQRLSEGALQRASLLSWDAKAKEMAGTFSRYRELRA
jgi:glycosyltransferase involved in cell wall biosynthesis